MTKRIDITIVWMLLLLMVSTLLVTSCKDEPKEVAEGKHYSKNQKYLFKLLDHYKAEYFKAQYQVDKDSIRDKYEKKFYQFLQVSLGMLIDSMTVVVDTVIKENWLVTTQFHTRDIEFKYGMQFKDSMDVHWDSLYQWYRTFKPGTEVSLNFTILGSIAFNPPDKDSTVRTIRIFAYPEKLGPRPQ